ncbi:Alkylated DNA repair protein ALKBH8 homolog [Linum perenne]
MGLPRFTRPKGGDEAQSSRNLYVANCGPAVGLSYDAIASAFSAYGEVTGVYAADESGTRVIVSYGEVDSAQAALEALHGRPCDDLGGRSLHIRASVIHPGGKELLAAVDGRPWNNLSKRRVQHYGYEFCYDTRNVNTKRFLGELPSFVSPVLQRISSFPDLDNTASSTLDQLTVNEYPRGVGLSPHIDTHSAFEGLIFSLSLAGPCIMEFRQYVNGSHTARAASCTEVEVDNRDDGSNLIRKAIYLPPRSMLLLSAEARYAWNHYIPHHKIDVVDGTVINRNSRRVSFTLRKVRRGPCQCEFPQYCDSQR